MDSTKIHDATGGLLDGDGNGLSGGARAADAFFRLLEIVTVIAMSITWISSASGNRLD